MKVSILSENLQKGLAFVAHAISSRNQLPILTHVLLETHEGKLILSTTDLEIGIEITLAASIIEEGATTVPAKLFLELINTFPSGKLTLETQEAAIHITGANVKSVLATTPPEEFPKLYEEKGKEVLSLSGKTFQAVLKRIIFSSSQEVTRPALSGVLLKQTDQGILFVATDGYRLSLETLPEVQTGVFDKQLIIPSRLLRELQALKEDQPITLFSDQKRNQVLFSQGETVIVGRLIEAEFPSYEKILPTDTATSMKVDREEFFRAVKACAIFARDAANIITLGITKKEVSVSSQATSFGENTVTVEATVTGEENSIAFNAKYLLDFLSNVGSEEVTFEMTGPLNSGVFRISDTPTYLHLIMPIRTQG